MTYYNLISKGYDELYGEEQSIKHKIIKENLDIKNSDFLLDIGCGTGHDFKCNVFGLDPSIDLLQLKDNNQNNNIKNNINNKILAKAENIPFKDNIFDKVISVTSMHNFDDINQGINEIKRVGKKDFAFSILKKTKFFDEIEAEINENFNIKKIIDGKKDWIFICQKVFK